MKGLLLKDFYLVGKYCRIYVGVVILFAVVGLLRADFFIFLLYSGLLAGYIPVTLYSYDEREKWCAYSGTLPYSRDQLVSVKYLMVLLLSVLALLISGGIWSIGAVYASAFSLEGLLLILTGTLSFGLLSAAVMLPFMFKLGAEKGRIVYCVTLIGISAIGSVLMNIQGLQSDANIRNSMLISAVVLAVSVVLFAASWVLAIAFYRKREL